MHVHWLLDTPYELPRSDSRNLLESMLQALYRDLGSDSIQDLSRLLRLPGVLNVKDARNCRPSIPCTLVECDPNRRYPIATFERWVPASHSQAVIKTVTHRSLRKQNQLSKQLRDDRETECRLLERFDEQVEDRSRRDYAVVCGLLRLGMSEEQIWRLVCDKSKFRARDRSYFETTVENAKRDLFI